MMKKIIVMMCLLVIIVSQIKAQDRVKFGIMGAGNYSTITKPDQFGGTSLEDLNWKWGYKAGLISDIPIANILSIQPSLFFSSKGYSMEESLEDFGLSGQFSVTANYIELPVMLAFKIPFSDQFKFVISAGPYIAYGIGGKTGFEAIAGGASADYDWNTFDGQELAGVEVFPAMERFDWGLGLGAALEIGKIKFSINYDQGLQPVYEMNDSNDNSYHYGFWGGIGVFF